MEHRYGYSLYKNSEVLSCEYKLPLSFVARMYKAKIEMILQENMGAMIDKMSDNVPSFGNSGEISGVMWVGLKQGSLTAFIITNTTTVGRVHVEFLRFMLRNSDRKDFLSVPLTEVDKITKINTQLIEVKSTLHKAITAVLDRGEKMEELLKKTEDLTKNTIEFEKKAKRLNRCC